jgi:NTE family protein
MKKKRKTIGIAFGSGGIRGLAHVGVINALLKNNIPIDYVAGSSIGAWISAHYALYQDIELLEEYTVHKQREKFRAFLEPSLRGGVVKGKKIDALLTTWLGDSSFRDTKIPCHIVATDLISGNPIILKSGKLAKAAHASMAIPTLFAPIQHKGMLLVDGGTCNPVPDDVVKKMGADIVISVNLDNFKNNTTPVKRLTTFRYTANRSFEIMRHYLANYSMQNSDIIIEPKMGTIGITSWKNYFTAKIGPEIVKAGEREATKYISDIKKLLS